MKSREMQNKLNLRKENISSLNKNQKEPTGGTFLIASIMFLGTCTFYLITKDCN